MTDPSDTPVPHPPDPDTHSFSSNSSRTLGETSPSEAVPGEAEAVANVTIRRGSRTRSRHQRVVDPLPSDALVIHPPNSPTKATDKQREPPSPHRPAPQIRIKESKKTASTKAAQDSPLPPEVTTDPGTPGVKTRGGARGKRGGARVTPHASDESPPRADRQENLPAPANTSDASESISTGSTVKKKRSSGRDSAKKEHYLDLKTQAATAGSLDELAEVLKGTVATMKLYSSSSPTKPCLDLLDQILARLINHHEFPSLDESRETFSAVVSRSVSIPVKDLAAQVERQHSAIQSLAKTVEGIKNGPILSPCTHLSSPPSYAEKASVSPKPKVKQPPLPNPEEERLLVRFNGPAPPILSLPYPQILAQVNDQLTKLNLPTIIYTQKQSATSIFVVPATKSDLDTLTRQWDSWAPMVFPGSHLAPAATYTYIQVDGIPFAAVGSLVDVKRNVEERNPSLGPVQGTPMWVNKPPSEARIAAIVASGRTPPKAGSIFIRLQSREMVDIAVQGKRIVLAGTAPVVSRGYPNLRVCQCWGCYKYGHTRGRCGVSEARCGGCGKAAHGAVCAEKPSCVNCGGAHRSDSFSCPSRKRIAEQLRQRAIDTTRMLDEQMYARLRASPSPSLPDTFPSPLTSTLGLSQLPLAPRLPESY